MKTVLTAASAAMLALVAAGTLATGARAEYPEKSIAMVVPHAAGSPADAAARLIGDIVERALGQPVVVENRPGVGGTIGTRMVADAAPDGYTALFVTASAVSVAPAIHKDLPYDPVADLLPVLGLNTTGLAIEVHRDVPAKSVAELIAYGKANPGKLSFASAGVGSTPHLAGELFMDRTGVEMVHIPYKGSQAAVVDLLAGNVEVLFAPTSSAAQDATTGKARVLVVLGPKRPPELPDTPTAAEAGMPEIALAPGWFGLFLPAGTDPAIAEKLRAVTVAGLSGDKAKDQLANLGLTAEPMQGEDFARQVRDDTALYGEVAAKAGIQPN